MDYSDSRLKLAGLKKNLNLAIAENGK